MHDTVLFCPSCWNWKAVIVKFMGHVKEIRKLRRQLAQFIVKLLNEMSALAASYQY